jgi:hypothetical protein
MRPQQRTGIENIEATLLRNHNSGEASTQQNAPHFSADLSTRLKFHFA